MTNESKTESLRKANWCPGCSENPSLPDTHLCTGIRKFGPIPTISVEQSRAIDEILPFIPLSVIERHEAVGGSSINPLIPLLKGEIIMQNELIRVSTPDLRRKAS